MAWIRYILAGAIIGLAWAASLRGFMMVLAGPDSAFTYTGTFGIIIPTGIVVAPYSAGPNTNAVLGRPISCSSPPRS